MSKDLDRVGGFLPPSPPKDFDRFGGFLPLRCPPNADADDFDRFGGLLSGGLPERPRLRERALSLDSPPELLLFRGSFWLADRPRERALSLDSVRDGPPPAAALFDFTRVIFLVGLRLFPLDSTIFATFLFCQLFCRLCC